MKLSTFVFITGKLLENEGLFEVTNGRTEFIERANDVGIPSVRSERGDNSNSQVTIQWVYIQRFARFYE
jgi:hypothetical protein